MSCLMIINHGDTFSFCFPHCYISEDSKKNIERTVRKISSQGPDNAFAKRWKEFKSLGVQLSDKVFASSAQGPEFNP